MSDTLTSVNDDQFRQAMSSLAAGVTVITTLDADGQPTGATLSAVSSLSLNPKLVLACFDHKSGTLKALADEGKTFLIHILEGEQQDLAMHFAGKNPDKFASVEHSSFHGMPKLDSVACTLACHLHKRVTAGDHDIVIGEVFDIDASDHANPLMYCNHKMFGFRQLQGAPQ